MNLLGNSRLIQAICLLAALFGQLQMALALDMPTEQAVTAAMVFNFLKFTEFPPESVAKSPVIRLCVAVRESRQAEALGALANRRIGNRKLVVAEFTAQSPDCDVFYVDSRQRWNATLGHQALRGALTISTYPGFARDGGMIEISVQNDGSRFDINLAEGRRAGFHFSPEMLRLARQIHE